MMKPKDCATATALIIQGYLRANSENDESTNLRAVLVAIVNECDDWGENVGMRFEKDYV